MELCRCKFYRILFIFAFSCCVALPLFAGGSKEDPIQQANQLIANKQYDDATLVLADIIKNDPSRIDAAEALMSKIRQIRGNYNNLVQTLLEILVKEPDNYEKALDTINKISALYPNPTEKIRQQLEDWRITAKLQVDRSSKNKVMAQALDQIQKGQFGDAIATYIGGFTLQRSDFVAGTQKQDFKDSVLSFANKVGAAEAALKVQNDAVLQTLATFKGIADQGSGSLSTLVQDFPAFSGQLLQTIAAATDMVSASDTAQALRTQADRDYPGYPYNEYVRFLQEYMQGPPGKAGEGISFASRSLIDSEFAGTLQSLESIYNERKNETNALAGSAQWDKIAATIPNLLLAGNLYMRAEGLKGGQDLGSSPSFADIGGKLQASYRAVPSQTLLELRAYAQLNNAATQLAGLASLQGDTQNDSYSAILSAYDGQQIFYAQWLSEAKNALAGGSVAQADVDRASRIFATEYQQAQSSYLASARDKFAARIAGSLAGTRSAYLASIGRESQGLVFLNGPSVGSSESASGIYRYPDQALSLFTAMQSEFSKDLGQLDSLDSLISGSVSVLKDFAATQQTARGSQSLRADINAAMKRLGDEVAAAQKNIQLAQAGMQKAAQNLTDAESTISSPTLDLKGVDAADSLATQANQLYVDAFDKAYNKDLRASAYDRLTAVRTKIEKARNDVYLSQIRTLLTSVKTLFGQEDYQRAGDQISQAETLWEQTADYKTTFDPAVPGSGAKNEEIDYWRNRIAATNNATNERTISEADPAFFTLANYLNLAQVDFQEASRLMSQGKSGDAAPLISRAQGNLDNVLLVKPSNSDARILQLKLDQVSDPLNFPARLAKREADAIRASKGNASSNANLEELNALRTMDPGNDTLKQAIQDLRIHLGLDDSPLTIARRDQSNALVARAEPLSRSNNPVDLRAGLDLLSQAQTLNPQNARAGVLADQIRRKITATVDILSFEDEQKFGNATQLFLVGNIGAAIGLVTDLLKRHPTYSPLLKLSRQINTQIGSAQ